MIKSKRLIRNDRWVVFSSINATVSCGSFKLNWLYQRFGVAIMLAKEAICMTIAEKIQDLRIEKGLTQKRLAELMDVSRQSVSKWELGVSHS